MPDVHGRIVGREIGRENGSGPRAWSSGQVDQTNSGIVGQGSVCQAPVDVEFVEERTQKKGTVERISGAGEQGAPHTAHGAAVDVIFDEVANVVERARGISWR